MSAASSPPVGASGASGARGRGRRVARGLDGAWLALGFLTILPAPRVAVGDGAASWLSRAAGWFPLVGALVGGVAGGVVALAAVALPMPVAAALGVIAAIVLTRGLHEDGLADTADGLGVHGTRERRLTAMADSAVGAHGALAMACALVVAVAALAGLDAAHAARALVAAHVLARAAMVVVAAALPSARVGGLGSSLAVGRGACGAAVALGAGGSLAAAGGLGPGALAIGMGAVALAGALALQARIFGGRTGDTLGATGKLVEVAVLVALAGAWS